MHLYRPLLNAPLLIGIGAAFDFLSGTKVQAPKWMQQRGLEWLFSQSGIGVRDTAMGALFYVISGAVIIMIVAGLVFASVMAIRTVGGEYSGRDREGIVAASMFWYVTVAVYAVVWYAIYVTK